jgi:pyruvate carboxylase subunit B
MAKFIDVMDTTFRDGFQSVFGGRVLFDDFEPAIYAAKEAGITHYEFGGGARFQVPFFYLNENAFENMDKFRKIVGPEANLQTLSRGINTVALDTGSRDIIDLHARTFKAHGTTTIRNFDALNDVNNIAFSAERIVHHGLLHEAVVTIMDLPPGCEGAHDVAFYEKVLRSILDSGLPYNSICFKDATGTANPRKVYEVIKMARKLLPDGTHIRLHTQETAGISVAQNLAALDAGADGIDAAANPVSGGTSQPDLLTMIHAVKGMNYDFGFDVKKILAYEVTLRECLSDYFIPPEATQVEPLIPFSPMPGGALTANTQMLRDNNILDRFRDIILEMEEVFEKGGYGTSVTPISQFYFQQAFNNVMFGKWKKIAEGYGRMVLGYFGETPVTPDPEIVKLASEQLKLEPTTENPLDIADRDPHKSLAYFQAMLEDADLEVTAENLFIAGSCDIKGITYLKGNATVNVRKLSDIQTEENKVSKTGPQSYTVNVDGQNYNVVVSEGANAQISVTASDTGAPIAVAPVAPAVAGKGIEIKSQLPGNVWKVLATAGTKVKKDEVIMILEAMKMEIDVVAPEDGVIASINVAPNDVVENEQILATM